MPNHPLNGPEQTHSAVTHTSQPASHVAVATPAETGTIADTRARFGISRSTIYRLAAVGDIRMVKVGRTTLVDFTSVRAFLAQAPAAVLRSPGLLNKATPRG